ncbi:oligosaccharide repeat unit polymerase [Cohnella sp. OV330]|uniref:O-antigen polymerase n=1 Tax=Cohnella sp. OV330 TaxID=1855288 RepID=UPI0008EDB7DC|nr:O-antigen polymerase [Cohnella sp. OV330]SFB53571.1 oligosaccharide repeat unit polymerase [Cohnella sp. OV330]
MRKNASVWWMNPTILFAIVMGVVIAGAYLIPAQNYLMFYRVEKFIDSVNIWLAVYPAVAFVLGGLLSSVLNKGVKPVSVLPDAVLKRDSFIKFVVYALFAMTLFGYAVYFLIMVRSGFTVSLFLSVIKGEPGAIYSIKQNFDKITGVTSFTNFGIAFTILATYYQCLKGKKTFLPAMTVVFLLTLMRSIFFSERLALMEILVPAAIIWISMRLKQGKRVPLVRLYPLIGIVFVIGFFGLSEYFRSWLSYYVHIYPSFWEFVVTRFFGYYVTALNTGTLYIRELGFPSIPFPYYTWEWLWKIPPGGEAYADVYGVRPMNLLNNILDTMGNPEFNNPSGLMLPYHDYGFGGALIYMALLGYISGLLYAHFRNNHTFGMLLYPIWMVGILEFPRYLYFTSGRFFPCWVVLLLFTLVLHYNKRKIKSWRLSGVNRT